LLALDWDEQGKEVGHMVEHMVMRRKLENLNLIGIDLKLKCIALKIIVKEENDIFS